MTPSGTFPTPYGVSVPVFDSPHVKGEYLFSMDATAICCGIYHPSERARFVADATATGRFNPDGIHEYGGHRLVRVPLPRPDSPATPQIMVSDDVTMPLEEWVTALLDVHRWCDRADVMLSILETNFEHAKTFGKEFEPVVALAYPIMMTSALEHLAEHEIDCLEAAAIYALSVHPEWSKRAIEWLRPMSGTWFKDWIANRPTYRRFAADCLEKGDLLDWITGGEA